MSQAGLVPHSGFTGRILSISSSVLPSLLLVSFYFAFGLKAGLIVAVIASALIFGFRLIRRDRLRDAALGPALVLISVALTLVTGEARGFFLLPTVTPIVILLICCASMSVGRPLAGYLINPVARGPRDWRALRRFRALYQWSTMICVAVNAANAALQIRFYQANDLAALAVIHALTVPVFSVVILVTMWLVRRELRLSAQSRPPEAL